MRRAQADEIEIPFVEGAVHARLGLISDEPNSLEGEWTLLIEGRDRQPLALTFIAVAFDFPSAPVIETESALNRAGYEHNTDDVVTKPWAASWRLSYADAPPRRF